MATVEPASSNLPADLPRTIGMSLSGGGYRAAAFHLGALSYLDHTGLIDRLRAISTVSGGTFTGARYALALAVASRFKDFFCALYRDFATFDLVELGLSRLAGERPDVPSKRHDLIVCMAQVYSETFFRSQEASAQLFGEILGADTHIEEIAFNATEFRNGIAFRFQKSEKGRIGNGFVNIRREDASQIRIADIVAASSCFPGGFEPLAFPYDFAWPGNEVPADVVRKVEKGGELGPLAVMDGGIYDNQGLSSLLLADERRDSDLDLFIISDVNQPTDDMYPFPTATSSDGLSIGTLNLLARALMIGCAFTAVVETAQAFSLLRSGGFTFWDLFRYVIPIALASLTAYALWWTRRTIRREMCNIPRVGHAAWKDVRRLRLGQVLDMVRLRVTSLYAMASSIFMARIRALVYERVYRDERYEGRRVSNLIYHLLPSRRFFFDKDVRVAKPSPELHRVVEISAAMPTTLWFDEDKPYQLPCLVAAGQVTLCYNLMKYVVRRWGSDASQYSENVREFWSQLLSDWNSFVVDPYTLVRKLWEDELPAPPKSPVQR